MADLDERLRALAMIQKLPASIRVGAYDFAIEQWHATRVLNKQRWGECAVAEMYIGIQQDMPTRIKAADTLLHEISHAVWWAFGAQDDDKEERVVLLTATGWLCVYRDNPWLLDWLKECIT